MELSISCEKSLDDNPAQFDSRQRNGQDHHGDERIDDHALELFKKIDHAPPYDVHS